MVSRTRRPRRGGRAATIAWAAAIALAGPCALTAAATPAASPSLTTGAVRAVQPGAIATIELNVLPTGGVSSTRIAMRDALGGHPRYVIPPKEAADIEYDLVGDRLAALDVDGNLFVGPANQPRAASFVTLPPGMQPLVDVEWAAGSTDTLYAVASDNTLYRIALGAASKATVTPVATLPSTATSVRPSPTQDSVAVAGPGRLWVVDLATAGITVVSAVDAYSEPHASWSPDGSLLLFQEGPAVYRSATIYSLDSETLSIRRTFATLARTAYLLGGSDVLGRQYLFVPESGFDPSALQLLDPASRQVTSSSELPNRLARYDLAIAAGGVDETGSCAGFQPTIVGTSGPDTIVGTAGRDVIFGLEGDDDISGLGGGDIICGGAGNDVLRGGDGNDRLYGDTGDDEIHGDAGSDTIGGSVGNDTITGDDGDDQVNAGPGDDTVTTGAGNDIVRDGSGTDDTDTGDGDDLLIPYASGGSLRTGAGDDRVLGTLKAASVDTGDGDDQVSGYAGGSQVVLGAGDDYSGVSGAAVDGGPGADYIEWATTATGGDGGDRLDGAFGRFAVGERYDGGPGNDTLTGAFVMNGDQGADDITIRKTYRLFGGGGTADGGPGSDTLNGSSDADRLSGGPGDDHIVGGDGDDVLLGNAGSDELNGGRGEDRLDGGAGRDRCRVGDTAPQVACEIALPPL